MNDADVEALDDFWRTISRNEEFIRLHGHHGCPDWENKWHQDLEDAYARIRPLLSSVTQRQIFHGLPGNLNPFDAENYHHALIKFLNPPERWFGNVGVLGSAEYLMLKRAAEEEETAVAQFSHADVTAESATSSLEDLNDTAITILESMDLQQPRTWKEIADQSGYPYDVVRRYSKKLQESKRVKKIGQRGFVRLIRLSGDCDSV